MPYAPLPCLLRAGLMSAGSLVLYDFVLPRICPPAVLHGLYDPKAAAAHHKALSEHSQDSRSGGRGHGAGGAVSEHQPLLLEVQLSGDLSAGEDTRHSGTCYSDTCHVGATAGTPGTSGPEGVGERGLQRSLEGARGSSGSLGIGAHGGEAAAGSCRSRSPGVSGHGRDEARALLLPAGGAAPTLPVSVTVPAPEAGPGTGVLRRSGALGALGGGGDAAGRGGLGVSAGCSGEGAAAAGGGTEGVGAVGYGEEEEEDVPPPRLWRCIALCWPLCGCLFATYVATLSIFPGFLAEDIHVRQAPYDAQRPLMALLLCRLISNAQGGPTRTCEHLLMRAVWGYSASERVGGGVLAARDARGLTGWSHSLGTARASLEYGVHAKITSMLNIWRVEGLGLAGGRRDRGRRGSFIFTALRLAVDGRKHNGFDGYCLVDAIPSGTPDRRAGNKRAFSRPYTRASALQLVLDER